jgi:pre-mRNA-processing factor 17
MRLNCGREFPYATRRDKIHDSAPRLATLTRSTHSKTSTTAIMGLVDYDASSDEETPVIATSSTKILAAPDVSLEDPMQLRQSLIKPTDTRITHNMTYEQLTAPEAGPQNPFMGTDSAARKRKNVPTGFAEESGISDATFRAQHRTFNSFGYAAVGESFVGDQNAVVMHDGKDVVQLRHSKKETEAIKRKRQKKGDASILEGEGAYLGPWAKYTAATHAVRDDEDAEEYESEEEEEEVVAPISNPIIDKAGNEYLDVNTGGVGKETTEFHGSEQYDYMGRTYMHVPQDLDIDLKKEPGTQTNFIPKKLVHTWKGHTKPITALRFFPTSGHLLLSSANDSKVKVSLLQNFLIMFKANSCRFGTSTTSASCYVPTTDTRRRLPISPSTPPVLNSFPPLTTVT